ncbi:hypothetical protein ABZV34_04110 [Streptomyces sp. NPDC005195]|uniref:hypothetical protein n=1 Tax=Streptomyces sp. NPDC005195 TaxID=3154561 RepID=UPI0033B001BF
MPDPLEAHAPRHLLDESLYVAVPAGHRLAAGTSVRLLPLVPRHAAARIPVCRRSVYARDP